MMTFGVSFAQPWFLLAIVLVVPALWWARRGAGRVVFSSLRALPAGGGSWRTALAWVPDALLAIAVGSLVIALAGPRKGDSHSRVHRDGIAIMMVVDHSGSMRAEDLASADDKVVTRLDAVKQVFQKFVLGGGGLDGRDDDAIGLIAFAHYADTLSPITLDHGNLLTAVRQLDVAADPQDDGTAIGAGLELGVQRLADFKAKSKIIVLLTDGESNIHTIDEQTAIDDAKAAGIKVYTIGAGTNGVAPITIDGRLMQMRVEIDEELLRKIADSTGGHYFRATDHDSLAKIYGEIDRLERTQLEETRFKEFNQYYGGFVAAALALVVLALGLRGSVLRRLP